MSQMLRTVQTGLAVPLITLNGEFIHNPGELNVSQEKAQEETKVSSISKVQVKQITFTRISGGKWDINFIGDVSRRDINLLRITMLREYSRMKSRNRLKRMAELRRKESKDVA